MDINAAIAALDALGVDYRQEENASVVTITISEQTLQFVA